MRPSDLKAFLAARIKAKIERPVLIEGSPGIGKTDMPSQVASELGIAYRVIHAPLQQPEDYGMPVVSADRKDLSFIVSSGKFPIVGSDCPKSGILTIDELPQADNAGQKILANLALAREIHGHKLMPDWTLVFTGNRASDRAGANRLLSHLRSRVTTVGLDVSLDDWTNWAFNNAVATEVISFIRFRPELLNAFDPQIEINPTPRAWVNGVSKTLGSIPKSCEFESFKGDVGEGAASEFLGYLQIYRELPSPDAILMNPTTHEVPTKPAVVYALCGALATHATTNNFGAIMKFISRLQPEFTVLFVRDALRREPKIKTSQDFIQWAAKDGAKIMS